MHKFYEENCLVDQIYVRAENRETVKTSMGDIKVLSFERFKVGDGIERKKKIAAKLLLKSMDSYL